MKIAVEGCAHGELDKIYESLQALERKNNIKVDLLIICGDFQAVRNHTDLECMAVPPKYRKLNTFYKYYSGEKKAPVLTIFVGGNHEASNYLSELGYGGWVCPNIYYMGYANVINIGGIRIAGLSGIFKGHDYLRGHFEHPPYNMSTVKSVYHVRNLDVFRLKLIKKPIDICISHDWPRGVYHHGNLQQLLRFKPFFQADMESNKLGSAPAEEILSKLKPKYWFAAHLHCKFSAVVPHNDEDRPFTKFLALDKCLPRRRFLQILDIEGDSESLQLEYDTEWLSILQKTNHLLSVSRTNNYMPGADSWSFTPGEDDMQTIDALFNSELKIPNNFTITADKHFPGKITHKDVHVRKYLNPQTQTFCKLLKLTDPNEAVSCTDSLSISDFSGISNTSDSFINISSNNPDEISCSDTEEEDQISITQNELSDDISEPSLFYIDKTGSSLSSNKAKFLESQFCSSPIDVKSVKKESFPEIKTGSTLDENKDKSSSGPIVFKRRNFALYANNDSDGTTDSLDKKLKH